MASAFDYFKILSGLVVVIAVSIGYMSYAARTQVGPSGYGLGSTGEKVAEGAHLSGKVAIVTGANSGIGKETAMVLALHGAHVIVMARNLQDAKNTVSEITAQLRERGVSAMLTALQCDLASLSSIEIAVKEFLSLGLPLHFLVNNAGVMALPSRTVTSDGFEMQMGVNHLGHFHLTNLLVEKLIESQPSRVICVSSYGHRFSNLTFLESPLLENKEYTPFTAYGNSKFANILHAQELHKRYSKQGLLAYSLHPGSINTNIGRHMTISSVLPIIKEFSLILKVKTIPQGSATTLYTILKAPENESGNYYDDSNLTPVSPNTIEAFKNDEVGLRFWETSQNLIKEKTKIKK